MNNSMVKSGTELIATPADFWHDRSAVRRVESSGGVGGKNS